MTSYLNYTNKTEITNVQMPEGETVEIKDASSDDKGVIKLTADIGGDAAAPMVRRVNGNKLPDNSALSPGQTLIAVGTHEWKYGRIDLSNSSMFEENSVASADMLPKSNLNSPGIITLSGDLNGTWDNVQVSKIKGHEFPNPSEVQSNQFLTWDGNEFKFKSLDLSIHSLNGTINTENLPNASISNIGIIKLSGDLGGNYLEPVVKKINGISISSNAPINNQVLQYNGTAWTPTTLATYSPIDTSTSVKGVVQLAGDLGGIATAPSVLKINGTSVSVGGSLSTGQVLRATGTNTAVWGAINLASSSAVTGVLPAANIPNATLTTMGSVTLTGDLGGTAASPSVVKLRGVNLSATAPTTNQVLQYNGSTWLPSTLAAYTPTDATTGAKGVVQLAGDLGGTAAAPTVIKLSSNVAFTGSFVPTDIVNSGVTASKGELIRIKTPIIDITGSSIKDTLIWTTPPRFKLISCMLVCLSPVSQAALQNVNLSIGTTSGGSNLLSYNLIGNETATSTPLSTNPTNYFLTANGIYFRRGMGTVYTGTIEIVLHGFLF